MVFIIAEANKNIPQIVPCSRSRAFSAWAREVIAHSSLNLLSQALWKLALTLSQSRYKTYFLLPWTWTNPRAASLWRAIGMLCPFLTGQFPLLGHRTLTYHCPLSTDCSKLWETKEAYSSPLGQFPGDSQLPLQVPLSVTQVRLANSPCSSNTRLPWKPPTKWPIVIFSHWVLNSLQTVLSVTSCGCIVLILGTQDRWGHAEWNPQGLYLVWLCFHIDVTWAIHPAQVLLFPLSVGLSTHAGLFCLSGIVFCIN